LKSPLTPLYERGENTPTLSLPPLRGRMKVGGETPRPFRTSLYERGLAQAVGKVHRGDGEVFFSSNRTILGGIGIWKIPMMQEVAPSP